MSTVSSVYNYQYDRNLQGLNKKADEIASYDDSNSSSSTASSATSSGSALSSDSTDSNSALNQLLSTLMTLVLNLTQGGSSQEASSQTSDQSQADYFTSLDSDGNGTLSQAEFTAARPDGVTEDMANNLFAKLDADGDGAISTEEFSATKDAGPNGPPPPPPTEDSGISSLDTDGDGVVSQAEFLAARPDNVTEEDATSLFGKIDSDGDGMVSEEELKASRPQDGPRPPSLATDATGDNLDTVSASLDDLISRLEEISKAYQSFGTSEETTSSSVTV